MKLPPEHFWGDLLREYLHDPPDKPLDIRGHASRGVRYAVMAAGREIGSGEHSGAGAWADQRASEIERMPLPNAGENYHRAIGLSDGKLWVSHPLSGVRRELACPALDEEGVSNVIQSLCSSLDAPQERFLAVWRLLPERLSTLHPAYPHLPAETRVPDHTLWNHLDTVAGLYAAYEGNEQLALLSLALGPVQPFIAAARSVRDLWSGSMLLSWLTFQGMVPLLEQLGPTSLVFPQLRGNPLMDLWLRENFPELQKLIPLPDSEARKAPCLPNRFVALVPLSRAKELAKICRKAVFDAWKDVARDVHKHVDRPLRELDRTWDKNWHSQVKAFFSIQAQILPWQGYDDEAIASLFGGHDFSSLFSHAGRLRELVERMPPADRPGYAQDSVGRWQARIELMGRLMESRKLLGSAPDYFPVGPTPPKCSLLGSYEQLGPDTLSDSAEFWNQAQQNLTGWTRLRKNERFSAIALIKRYAAETFLLGKLGLRQEHLQIPDTATVAATHWLKKAGINPKACRDWSGQWLYWQSRGQDTDEGEIPADIWEQIRRGRESYGSPPAYYAILMIDGDEMGKWLQGEKSPPVKKAFHSEIVNYYRKIKADDLLDAQRPVTPAYHAAISEALAHFALRIVPDVVADHGGTLIYAGGDDVLALLPLQNALACALKLNQSFKGDPAVNGGAPAGYFRYHGQDLLMMGSEATLSAGLAAVHYKEDLRLALDLARKAEKKAKEGGRNALVLAAARRSGENAQVLCHWDELDWMQDWVKLFMPDNNQKRQALSNRWAYHLRDTLPVMETWPMEMIQAEIRRQVDRMEDAGALKKWFDAHHLQVDDSAGKYMANWFGLYLERRLQRIVKRSDVELETFKAECLNQFIITCQTLAFLARGRED